jgi:hypothetical protein
LVRNALDRTDVADVTFACSRILYSYQVYGIERLQQCQPTVAEVLVAIEHGAKRLNHARRQDARLVISSLRDALQRRD